MEMSKQVQLRAEAKPDELRKFTFLISNRSIINSWSKFLRFDQMITFGAAELVQKVIDEEQVHKNGWSCSFLNEMTRCLSEYPDEECQIFIRGFISYLKSDELNRRDQFKLTQLLTFMTMKKIENLNRAVCDMKTEINEFKDGLVDGSLAPQIKTYLNNILKATSIHDSIECMPRGTMTILAS